MIKCLKKLCISLLIGLPILFVNYSNAGLQEFDLGVAEDITANSDLGYSLLLQPNANFLLNDEYKVVVVQGEGLYPTKWYYFWNGSGMYLMNTCYGGYNCDGSIRGQGFFNYVNIVDLNNIDMDYAVNMGFTPIDDFISNSDYYQPDKLLVGGYGQMQSSSLCFGYSNINKAVCFSWDRANWDNCGGQPQYCTNGQLTYISDSLGLSSLEFENIKSSFTDSPFSNISVFEPIPLPDYEFNENDDYTNGQIIEGFEAMGISEEFCYGGFALDNIFNVGDTPENFTGYMWGSGVNILDIYDSYSGAFSTPKGFLRNFYQAYLDNNYNSFYGSTKSLYGFFDQIEKTDISQVGFNSFMAMITPTNVYEYCYLKFKTNPNAKYDGDNRNAKFAFYSSGTINLGGRFSFSGNNNYFSGVVTGVDSLSGFFANMNAIFQGNLGSVGHQKAMLPTYIIVFMLAIILVRILKH